MDGCDEEMDTLKSLSHSQIDVMKIFIPNRHSNTNPCLKIICLANQAGVSCHSQINVMKLRVP